MMRSGEAQELLNHVRQLRGTREIYPPAERILYALELTPFEHTRVVIVGQDPYHGPGQADGLAFSVPDGVKAPPSLRNIFKEIADDIYDGAPPTFSTDLSRWARQGVLLLNTHLTVEAGQAGSHRALGWERLTDQIIGTLADYHCHLVFMLWGSHAQAKRALLDPAHHLVLEAAHPSPLSAYRGFLGCRHFSQANTYLQSHGKPSIVW